MFLNVIHQALQPFGAKNIVAESQDGGQFPNDIEPNPRNGLLQGLSGDVPTVEHRIGKTQDMAGEGLVSLHQFCDRIQVLVAMGKFANELGGDDG